MTEQEAIERLRYWAEMEPLAPWPEPADLRVLLDREKRLTEALEKVKVLARAEDMRPGNAGLPVTAWAFISEITKVSRAALARC